MIAHQPVELCGDLRVLRLRSSTMRIAAASGRIAGMDGGFGGVDREAVHDLHRAGQQARPR